MAGMFADLEGHWYSVSDADPRAVALYSRHYSVINASNDWTRTGFAGPGEKVILMTAQCDALFVWRRKPEDMAVKQQYDDGQRGLMCSVFRNESPIRSSELIQEAMEIAWRRWPNARLFTYVWDSKVKSANPGYCFKKSGWRVCGRNADGRLTILEIMPPAAEAVA